jgi:hypothetical protein
MKMPTEYKQACLERMNKVQIPVISAYSGHQIVRQSHKKILPEEMANSKKQFDDAMKELREYLKQMPDSSMAQRVAAKYHHMMRDRDWNNYGIMRRSYVLTGKLAARFQERLDKIQS